MLTPEGRALGAELRKAAVRAAAERRRRRSRLIVLAVAGCGALAASGIAVGRSFLSDDVAAPVRTVTTPAVTPLERGTQAAGTATPGAAAPHRWLLHAFGLTLYSYRRGASTCVVAAYDSQPQTQQSSCEVMSRTRPLVVLTSRETSWELAAGAAAQGVVSVRVNRTAGAPCPARVARSGWVCRMPPLASGERIDSVTAIFANGRRVDVPY